MIWTQYWTTNLDTRSITNIHTAMDPVILDKNLDRILDKRLNPREEDISLLPHLLEKTWEEGEEAVGQLHDERGGSAGS